MNYFVDRFSRAMNDYISDIQCTGHSAATLGNYRRRLTYFRDFWEKSDPKTDPTKDDVRAWRDSLLANGVKPATVKQYLIELHTFFEYGVEEEIYDFNPVIKRLMPKIKEGSREPYSKILDSTAPAALWENTGTGRNWARNYALIVILLDGKIRNAELLNLKLSDVDFTYKELTIRKGKGNKRRVVSLSDISITAIQLYLASGIRPGYCTEEDYLFGSEAVTGKWHKCTGAWLSQTVEKHVYRVTGQRGFRSHSMRHNGSMFDLNNGISLERLQAELGHSSVTTTELYAGRLGSKRHQDGFKIAICSRNYWAEKNKAMLEKNNMCA